MNEPIEFHVFGGKIGESIVVRLPGDHWGVVDNYTPTLKDPQSNPTMRFLDERGVKHLSFLCLTHPHDDHYRGMSALLERFDPDRVWIFGAMTHRDLYSKVAEVIRLKAYSTNLANHESENADELVKILDCIRDKYADRERSPRLDVRRLQLEQPLMELPTTPCVKITSIGASGGQVMAYEKTLASCFDGQDGFLADRVPRVNHNLISGGLLVEYGDARIVLGGDIEKEAWQDTVTALAPQQRLRSQLVKVSHHGSTNGCCNDLWEQLSPQKTAIAVITPYSSKGLPSAEGLGHISAHANRILAVSVKAVALANDWDQASDQTAFSRVSADALVALRAVFAKAHRPSDRLEGCCSFMVSDKGIVTHIEKGEAGAI
jgi:beta-lactamase superfamily II metal-dependent hydrolase